MNSNEQKRTNDQWREWWGKIRELSETQRSRSLTCRCKDCGKGSLQGINTYFPDGEVEGTCEECSK